MPRGRTISRRKKYSNIQTDDIESIDDDTTYTYVAPEITEERKQELKRNHEENDKRLFEYTKSIINKLESNGIPFDKLSKDKIYEERPYKIDDTLKFAYLNESGKLRQFASAFDRIEDGYVPDLSGTEPTIFADSANNLFKSWSVKNNNKLINVPLDSAKQYLWDCDICKQSWNNSVKHIVDVGHNNCPHCNKITTNKKVEKRIIKNNIRLIRDEISDNYNIDDDNILEWELNSITLSGREFYIDYKLWNEGIVICIDKDDINRDSSYFHDINDALIKHVLTNMTAIDSDYGVIRISHDFVNVDDWKAKLRDTITNLKTKEVIYLYKNEISEQVLRLNKILQTTDASELIKLTDEQIITAMLFDRDVNKNMDHMYYYDNYVRSIFNLGTFTIENILLYECNYFHKIPRIEIRKIPSRIYCKEEDEDFVNPYLTNYLEGLSYDQTEEARYIKGKLVGRTIMKDTCPDS